MPIDNLKDMFFAEAEELLESLGEGLQEMEAGEADTETVHAVFRAVHSIKGTAGAFGFDNLVSFTHHFETVLDLIRSEQIEVDDDLMRLLLRSSDILSVLVDLARSADTEAPASMAATQAALVAICDEAGAGTPAPVSIAEQEAAEAATDNGPAVFEPVAFAPIELDLDATETDPAALRYEVVFKPERKFFTSGHDFERLLAEISKLGNFTCEAGLDDLPKPSEFDPSQCYLSWTFVIETEVTAAETLDAFMFLEDFCTIRELQAEDAPADLPILEPVIEQAPAAPEIPQTETASAPPSEPKKPADPAPSEKPAPKASEQKSTQGGGAKGPMLRVDPERVDRLINTVGELIINQAVISQRIVASGLDSNSDLMGDLDDFQHLAREIQESVMAIRAQPVKPLFQRMQRIVRETVEALGKNVALITEGENTEVDKTLVERLADPLTHMIRNAIDHGIETTEARSAAGKNVRGTIRLSASHRSGHVQIEISDDGAGVNRPKVFEKAVEKGLIPADAKLSDAEIDNLLFLPGFSTAAEVTNLSGRGVGMDVVRTAISQLGGRVAINSSPGQGTTFTISMPLTLAVMDGMVVEIANETMVVPLSSIVETIRPEPSDIQSIGPTSKLLSIRNSFVPIVSLASVLGLTAQKFDPVDGVLVLVRSDADELVALAVDDIADQRQVVIKSLEGNYGAIPGISAATILGDGRVALIIDTESILNKLGRASKDTGTLTKEIRNEPTAALG